MQPTKQLGVAVMVALFSTVSAQAAVIVSSDATQNMTCANGVCAPTASKAVLNAGDLETLLASGNVEVTTTGEGVQARDITFKAPVTWSSGSVLTLDARKSIAIDRPISIAGLAGLALDTNDGGRKGNYIFGKKGNITFANLSSSLTINGVSYTLIGDLKTLASDIAANPSGNFALANNYDASGDGTYASSPIASFGGTFDGLGTSFSNLSVDGATQTDEGTFEGLFAYVERSGTVRNIAVSNAVISVPANVAGGGVLVGGNYGTVQSCGATGSVSGGKLKKFFPELGGLVGFNDGTIAYSYAGAKVTETGGGAGGLVGLNGDEIVQSYATGDISGPDSGGLVADNEQGVITGSYATGHVGLAKDVGGGLVGNNWGAIVTNSYATGSVSGGAVRGLGGLIGQNAYSGASVSFSYSTGSVRGTGSVIGGLIGDDESQSGSLDDTYWDTDTSGITNLSQGAGNIANDPGITGLTTVQFQSGLPAGFDPKVWAEKASLNGGLPYLLANPPPRH
ncbi:MAG: GLUG motif-containing protein [Rhizomicrobium sp.]